MSYYVNMRDNFMSGWGPCRNGFAYLSVRCTTEAQAQAIYKAASRREEMSFVRIAREPVYPGKDDHLSIRQVDSLSGSWLDFMEEESAHDRTD